MSFSFVDTENNIRAFWQKHDIFNKSLTQTKDGTPYIFYDGPPFATGLPHHGHLLASTIKDVVPRYFTMMGFYVDRRFGWDCHGLPIEHEINKSLGLQAHEALEQLGIKGYNQACRDIVMRYSGDWRITIERLGRWVDFDNGYKTMDPDFMESVWWVFSQLWEKSMIYEGTKVVPFSTALGTVLSNFEAGSNYQDVQDPAITVLFKLEDADELLAIWTTTPWTLPSNLGIAVHPNSTYCLVDIESIDLPVWIVKERVTDVVQKRSHTIIRSAQGSTLVGKPYQPLFPDFKQEKDNGCFTVLSGDFVSTDTGTGLVHMAPAFGEDDYHLFQKNNLPMLACPIDDQGRFTSEVSAYAGMYVKDADKPIIA